MYIPIFKYNKQGVSKKLLKKAVRHYKISCFLTITTPEKVYFVGLNAFEKRRIEKMYAFAKTSSLFEFQKYAINFIPVRNCIGYPIKINYFKSKNTGMPYSKPHLDFFGLDVEGDKCGKGDLKVFYVEKQMRNVV